MKNIIRHPAAALAVLVAILLAETSWFANRHSLTYDETIYLNLSLRSLSEKRLDPRFMALGAAPLPALLTYAGPLLFSGAEPRPSLQDARMSDPQPLCAVAVAAAMSAKYSLLFLLPVAAGVFLLSSVRRQSEQHGTVSTSRVLGHCVVHSVLLACLVLPLCGDDIYSRGPRPNRQPPRRGSLSS